MNLYEFDDRILKERNGKYLSLVNAPRLKSNCHDTLCVCILDCVLTWHLYSVWSTSNMMSASALCGTTNTVSAYKESNEATKYSPDRPTLSDWRGMGLLWRYSQRNSLFFLPFHYWRNYIY